MSKRKVEKKLKLIKKRKNIITRWLQRKTERDKRDVATRTR